MYNTLYHNFTYNRLREDAPSGFETCSRHHPHHHHHLPPWIRSFDLFRHRRTAIVSWGVHDLFCLEVCSWGRVSGVWCCPFFEGGWSSFVCIWVSRLVFQRRHHELNINLEKLHFVVYIYIISIVKPTKRTNVSNLFYFGMALYMFRTVFPSVISSSRLYIQQQAIVKQILLSAC